MAISIVISDTVGFKVKGTINNAAGVPQPFDFNLTAHRLDADEIQDKIKTDSEASLTDFIVSVVTGWSGVKNVDEKPLEFSEDNLRLLCKLPGIAAITFRTYLAEVGAKEKN